MKQHDCLYSEKVARREEAARLAALEPEEPDVQPEPEPTKHVDGLGDVPALDTFEPEQLVRYHALVAAWQDKTRRIHPGSKARRVMRATALREAS
jgi:hypothetical protein